MRRLWGPFVTWGMAVICSVVSGYFFVTGRWLFSVAWLAAFGLWFLAFLLSVNRLRSDPIIGIRITIRVRPYTEEATQDDQGNQ